MAARVLIPLAPGFEEIEAVTLIDVLRRGNVDVTVAGLQGTSVTGSHNITVAADALLADVQAQDFDMIVLPGGMPGAQHLEDDQRLRGLLQKQARAGKPLAAVCAAPKVLAAAGLLAGKKATSYPGFLDPKLVNYQTGAVVRDGNITTSRGPGTVMRFALDLVEQLSGAETAKQLAEKMLI